MALGRGSCLPTFHGTQDTTSSISKRAAQPQRAGAVPVGIWGQGWPAWQSGLGTRLPPEHLQFVLCFSLPLVLYNSC